MILRIARWVRNLWTTCSMSKSRALQVACQHVATWTIGDGAVSPQCWAITNGWTDEWPYHGSNTSTETENMSLIFIDFKLASNLIHWHLWCPSFPQLLTTFVPTSLRWANCDLFVDLLSSSRSLGLRYISSDLMRHLGMLDGQKTGDGQPQSFPPCSSNFVRTEGSS